MTLQQRKVHVVFRFVGSCVSLLEISSWDYVSQQSGTVVRSVGSKSEGLRVPALAGFAFVSHRPWSDLILDLTSKLYLG